MVKELNRVYRGVNGVVYVENESKEKYLLKIVDREYSGRKKPVYQFKKYISSKKVKYITGLFETRERDVYVGDIMDNVGCKTLLTFNFQDKGRLLQVVGDKSF